MPVMRSNHPEKTQRLIPQDSSGGIIFLRLEGTRLRTQITIFYSGQNLLRVKTKDFQSVRFWVLLFSSRTQLKNRNS